MMKLYKDGIHREFTNRDIENFKGGDDPDNFLTMAEKQQLILHELEAIRATDDDDNVPGYEFVKLYAGRTIGIFSWNLLNPYSTKEQTIKLTF